MAMCPRAGMGEVSNAISKCPFLHAIKEFEGEDCAARLALNPFANASESSRPQPILPEDPAGSIAAVFRLFHGKQGPIPLAEKKHAVSELPSAARCPVHPMASSTGENADHLQFSEPELSPCPALPMMASISLSGFKFLPDPGDVFRRNQQQRPKPRNQKKHQQQGKEPPKPQQQSNASSTTAPQTSSSSSSSISPSSNSSKSPLSSFGPLGGLLPLAAASGKLSCPPAIVAMRAAVAGLKPVRQLRPQALPIRSLAMAGTAIMANVPCGMWREHTRKFGPEWFVAVHATIPFVAMLRKAVLMPRWAILLTIAGAVAGQQMGAKLERARLKQYSETGTMPVARSCAGQQRERQQQQQQRLRKVPAVGVAS